MESGQESGSQDRSQGEVRTGVTQESQWSQGRSHSGVTQESRWIHGGVRA